MADVIDRKAATQNFANEIWTVADILHGPFNDDEYGEVILPFSLLRRFECVLDPKKTAVQAAAETLDKMGIRGDDQYSQLCAVAGLPFYNLSNYRLSNLG
ncbi:MAG: type I restriction-modification system subunit M N-terminal domain-containing protein, partial [Sutterella wadsworthensis]|nr:type I restriction-modification system subunit M N-terminal domain-containing protein [Sutterella wadsworthensis]